jgi:tetratricopeptide (TPR) repeat protein
VFISHTSELREFPAGTSYVAAVERAISAAGHVIVNMADFPATDQPAAQVCTERVRGCEVYIGVLGTRYGSLVRDRPEVSYTELEFDTATAARMDRLVFLLDVGAADVGIPVRALIDHESGARQEAFRRRVRDSGLVTGSFASPAALGQLVERSLRELVRSRGGTGPAVAIPRQLPAAVPGFAGRAAELKALADLLEEAAGQGRTVVISAIDGTAGIGKTALAVQWAHQVAGRFPDGQLYANLRGFDPARTPMTSAEAVRGFLDAFEVPAARVPVSLDAQEALYRSLLAGRRVLVLLDNARDTGQVRPLLPGSPGCSAVVTSRNRLTGLIADGARPLTVDLLTDTEASQMLARRLGADRVKAQPQAVQQIIARCARLPLALSIVAARAAAHPDFPLTALAEELRDVEGRLPALDTGEAATSVTAVFSWSYRQLTDPAARLFRLLGLHPGPDITAPAAASLAAVPLAAVRPMLAELYRANLITEHTPGRFTFHDLLRVYASTQTRAHDPDTDRNAALQRMLDHYLHTAQAAWSLSHPHQQHPITLAPQLPGVTPEEPADYPAAWAWFTAEYPVLLAAIQLAAATGHHAHAWQLPHTLVPFFERQGHWRDFAATHHTALTAAQDHADQQGQAHAHLGIGQACARIGRLDQTRPHLQHALRLFEELGDQAGQSHAHSWLGMTFQTQECHEEALTHRQQAVNLARAHGGYPRGLAAALNSLGWGHALLGDAQQALTYSQQSLALFQDLGDRWGEAAALDTIGYAHHHLGDHQQAASCFERVLAIDQEVGDLYSQATDYDHLGDAHHAAGNTTQARHAWQQALNILDQLSDVPRLGPGYADPEAIRTKLHHHD